MNAPLTGVWSGYSLLRSVVKVPDLVQALKSRGFHSALLADWDSLAGVEEFDRLMRQAGLFPLLGVSRSWQVGDGVPHEVRLVAESDKAWMWLARFPDWDGQPEDGLRVILAADPELWWVGGAGLGSAVVVELLPNQRPALDRLPPGWRWVPASRVRYLHDGDERALAVLAQIGGFSVDALAERLPESPQSWWDPYRDWPQDAIWQPQDTGSTLSRGVVRMPRLDDVADEFATLSHWVEEGVRRRFGLAVEDPVRERLLYELGVIRDLGYAGYFLLVADLVGWAKRADIRVGPGRGSAAGSLVAFVLGITDINPLSYGLLFERFLNPARRTLPDIDLDFEDRRRGEVIDYLRERHGRDRVAQIGTYGTFGARAALRDVARVLGIDTGRVSSILKTVDWTGAEDLSRHAPALYRASQAHGLDRDWIDLARRIEGLPRHRSTHAAGVIISPAPLTAWLYCHGDAQGGWVTDFDMSAVEALGFVKLDVLGLRTLTTLARIERAVGIGAETALALPEDDRQTLKLLARGDTDGVFQLDGSGVKTLLRQMRPTSLREVMLVVALYRPGPMDAIAELLSRRASGHIPRSDDALESLWADTYGVMVYQEQLMAAVQVAAGLTLAEADLVRRAISKKDHVLLEREGTRIVANMRERGYTAEAAERFWERIRAFGDYGFNKSHAASYGLLAYYHAYLKAHYPLHFWAAELASHETGDRLFELMRIAVSQGIRLAPPHVNLSDVTFCAQDGQIVVGLSVIRGVGLDLAARIVEERTAGGRYRSLADLSARLGRHLPMRVLEVLESAGALAGLGSIASLNRTQLSLFDEPAASPAAAIQSPWPKAQGPVYVRVQPGSDLTGVQTAIRGVVARMAGDVPVAVISESGRAQFVEGVSVRGDFEAIEAIKDVEGVQAAGRQVTG